MKKRGHHHVKNNNLTKGNQGVGNVLQKKGNENAGKEKRGWRWGGFIAANWKDMAVHTCLKLRM